MIFNNSFNTIIWDAGLCSTLYLEIVALMYALNFLIMRMLK